jgi:hypothetical protein
MIGRACWDDLAVAVMRCSTTILRKLSWWRWSTVSHWLVVRRVTGVGYCHSLLLLRVSGGSSLAMLGL